MKTSVNWLAMAALAATVPACDGTGQQQARWEQRSESSSAADEGEPGAGSGAPKDDGQPAPPKVETDTFVLRTEARDGYAKDEPSQFAIHMKGRGKWHLNQDYPTSIELSAPEGVALPKTKMDKSDAAEFAEAQGRFDVPFTPKSKGEHRVRAHVDFAVCTEETCVPEQRDLAVKLPVE